MFEPDKTPPRHKPVDIAPQPEYKSSNFSSGSLFSSPWKAFLSWESTSDLPFTSISEDIVDDVSLPVSLLSVLQLCVKYEKQLINN